MKRNTVKRNVSLALGAVLVFGAVPAYAADAVTVKLNGSQMEFDVNPVIENSRTLVPFRKIFEALDCAVSYTKENGAQVVTANRGNQWITLEIGKNEITVDGETKKLDVAPKIVNGRTLVPLRAISEGLDCTVDWSADTKTVDIQKKQGQYAVTSAHISKNITDDKGNILITVAFEYPVIENKDNNAFITAVNEQYKKDAEAAISEAEAEFKDSAAAVLASEGKNYHPMVFTRSFEVSLNQDNLLSITQLDYANTYGAHPNTLKSSKTFNLAENKALTQPWFAATVISPSAQCPMISVKLTGVLSPLLSKRVAIAANSARVMGAFGRNVPSGYPAIMPILLSVETELQYHASAATSEKSF